MEEFCSADRAKLNDYAEAFAHGLMDESIFFVLCITSFAQDVPPLGIVVQSTLEQSTELRTIGFNALSTLSVEPNFFSGDFEVSDITEEVVKLLSGCEPSADWFDSLSAAIGQDFFGAVLECLPLRDSGYSILTGNHAIHNMFQLFARMNQDISLSDDIIPAYFEYALPVDALFMDPQKFSIVGETIPFLDRVADHFGGVVAMIIDRHAAEDLKEFLEMGALSAAPLSESFNEDVEYFNSLSSALYNEEYVFLSFMSRLRDELVVDVSILRCI